MDATGAEGPAPNPAADAARRSGAPLAHGGGDDGPHGEPISSREGVHVSDGEGIAAAFAPQDGTKKKEAFGLSRREIEVLALIAEGRTNREIGERLFISQKTVGVHVGNILAKLGASGRVEAAMVAIRLELVPTPLAARPVLAAR
jgi:DNA-binding CsgD family transcriptional regulator